MIDLVTETIWFFLPAIAANMVPVFVTHYNFMPSLALPLDGGRTWRHKRLLGDHKTVRGLIIGTIIGAAVGALQGHLFLGLLLGLGALTGDAIKSFPKRRLHIPPGNSWLPWDQVDFILGAILFSYPLAPLSLYHNLIAIFIIGPGSYLASYLGTKLKIKTSL